jgi:MFS family permease
MLALLPVGACIGAYLSGILLDTFSRRNCLVVTDLISIVGLCLGEYKAIYALYVSRIIIGMATGLNSMLVAYFIDVQVSLYIKEFTPPNLRGLLGSLNSTTISTGALVGFMVGMYRNSPDT